MNQFLGNETSCVKAEIYQTCWQPLKKQKWYYNDIIMETMMMTIIIIRGNNNVVLFKVLEPRKHTTNKWWSVEKEAIFVPNPCYIDIVLLSY